MKILTQFLPQVRRAVWSSNLFAPLIGCAFIVLEVFGRLVAKSDLHDIIGICGLLFLSILILERHRVNPSVWLAKFGQKLEQIFLISDAVKFEVGIDFRGSPPIPRKTPTILLLLPVVLACCVGIGLLSWAFYPQGWRQPLSQLFYVGYLFCLMVLWGTIVLSVFVGFFFLPFRLIDHFLGNQWEGQRITRTHLQFVTLYAVTMGLILAFLPFWILSALCGAALVAVAIGTRIPTASGVQFLWRKRPSSPIWSITSRKMTLLAAASIVLGLTALVSLAAGNKVLGIGEQDNAMPFTVTIGVFLGSLVPGILISGTLLLWLMWRHNPSRPCKPAIRVLDAPMQQRREIRRLFRRWGWRLAFDSQPLDALPVPIRIVRPDRSQATEFQPRWPLDVSLEDLREGQVLERLIRRDEINKRRNFLRGLEKLFRCAAQRRHPGGSGYWLAPHQWLLQGMLRDDMDENEGDETSFLTRPVGPPYVRLLHRSVRHYLHVLMNALEIDLIFVEDGVGHRRLNRVMRKLFEVYDKSGGKRRVEEVQLTGLTKVKVMIHEFTLDKPFLSSTYPEPRFENLGRARILHVFRNRGEEGERVEPPFDFEFEPEPLYV